MAIPLIPIIVGSVALPAGAALHAWLTESEDAWKEKDVFNARMRDMHRLALSLQGGLARCPTFMRDKTAVSSWRAIRDGFGDFYKDVGTLNYLGPSDGQVEQAKQYASRFYWWADVYTKRYKCGPALEGTKPLPNTTKPKPDTPIDWGKVIQWSVIGILGFAGLKVFSDFQKG